jgi:hypothetical protein
MIVKWVRESPWAVIILVVLALAVVGVIIESCNP